MNGREKLAGIFGTMTGAVCCGAISDEEIEKIMNTKISEARDELEADMDGFEDKKIGDLVDWLYDELKNLM